MLEFQHIIQINDPAHTDIADIPKRDLWNALVFRAKCPAYFNPTLASKIEVISESEFLRHLTFGGETLSDKIVLVEHESIHTSTGKNTQSMFAESKTTIEEPAAGHLIVRFEYRRDSANVPGEMEIDPYIKKAYLQNDLDAIRTIRELVRTGIPDADSWIQ
ncbi:MAG: AtaL-like protein [Pseudohongiellaceae bacterium]|nr:AtaL-like protein [Pseudohongiellaceae bacterium]